MYIPKNKIITGFYTNGGEFIIAGTNQSYTGAYYKLFDGNSYTGESPNDPKTRLLIKNIGFDTYKDPSFVNDPTLKYITYNDGDLLNYKYNLARPRGGFNPKKLLPVHVYPSPTDKDYQIGVFTRYFALKENETKYIEIDKTTYDLLSSGNEGWFWELYTVFILQWTITGDRLEVARTNKNITELTQREIGKKGLTQLFQGNYLQFYKGENEMMLPSSNQPTPPPTQRRSSPTSNNYSGRRSGY